MSRRKAKKTQVVPFEDRPGMKTVPLTFKDDTCGIAEVNLETGEVYATVIENSNFDRWLREGWNEESGLFDFSISMINNLPNTASVVLRPEEDASNDIEGEVLEDN